jgi:hypothetical protein
MIYIIIGWRARGVRCAIGESGTARYVATCQIMYNGPLMCRSLNEKGSEFVGYELTILLYDISEVPAIYGSLNPFHGAQPFFPALRPPFFLLLFFYVIPLRFTFSSTLDLFFSRRSAALLRICMCA